VLLLGTLLLLLGIKRRFESLPDIQGVQTVL
jgi:hypothetical protein